jgi:hypothetical protein
LFRLILPLKVPAMNSEFHTVASRPSDPSQTDAYATQPAHVHDEAAIGSVTYTYRSFAATKGLALRELRLAA